MKLKIAFLLLALGVLLDAFSIYNDLTLAFGVGYFLGSILIYLIAIFFVLAAKVKLRLKFLWGLLFILSWPCLSLLHMPIKNAAHQHFITANQELLQTLITKLEATNGSVDVYPDKIVPLDAFPSSSEKTEILDLLEKLKLNRIEKNKNFIFFETWGMLDNRRGVKYDLLSKKWSF